jgi:hypothetical protein
VAQIELPDGRLLAFGGVPVVAFNLAEAQRHARHGARTRRQALADVYRRDDGAWGIADPKKELDVVSALATAVLFSYAALQGIGAGDRLPDLRRLHQDLVSPRSRPDDEAILGRFLRGDADSCGDDAAAVVGALRPELLPSVTSSLRPASHE